MRIAQVGCGYWGQKLLRTWLALDAVEVAGYYDHNARRSAQLRRMFPRVPQFRTYRALLRHPRLDAVVIATPTATHVRLARQALRAGKHVFVEKPMASTLAEARDLRALARRSGRLLMVGHVFSYHADLETLRRWLRAKRLGRVAYLRCTRAHFGPARTDVSVLWDVCSHDVSIVLDMLGRLPLDVRAEGVRLGRGAGGGRLHDAVSLTLRFPGGVAAYLHGSWVSAQKQREVVVIGDRGAAVFDDTRRSSKLLRYDPGISLRRFLASRRARRIDPVPQASGARAAGSPLARECRHFRDCIRGSRPPRTDADAGYQVVRVLSAAQRSLSAGGKPVALSRSR